jgi:hypothetical protein
MNCVFRSEYNVELVRAEVEGFSEMILNEVNI